jgi:hypothetical protein
MATALEEMVKACQASDKAIWERESILRELSQISSLPTRVIPWWITPALAVAFAAGLLVGAIAMAWWAA